MKFRSRLFWLLALLAMGWIIFGMMATGDAVSNSMDQSDLTYEAGSIQRTAADTGTAIGAGISTAFVLCTGVPLFLIFAFMGWRNGVGYRQKIRHDELIRQE